MKNKFLAKWYLNCLEDKVSGSSIDRISMTLFNSKIKLTPHQIDAALFAFKSPLQKGVILADEVGLGKTIEAGIIIAQLIFEKKARIMIICPATLIRQWNTELYEKFGLDSTILDRKKFNEYVKKGYSNPFNETGYITICSYQFASSNSELIKNSNIETVIMDEAHKLRNSYTQKSIMANNIKDGTKDKKKILLTATPIQNSIMDLYGLTTFIDDNIFGDKNIFRYNYVKNYEENKLELKSRINNYLHRTLRNQVTQYIKYTKRNAETFYFTQTEEEEKIYSMLQDIISNSENHPYIIPGKYKHLLLLIMTKLMGSSIYALKGTLDIVLNRLIKMKETNSYDHDGEIIDFISDEIIDDFEVENIEEVTEDTKIDLKILEKEINYVDEIIKLCGLIKKESKFDSLLNALSYSFEHIKEIEAEEKVLIFTESRRTQDFLYEQLKKEGYTDILLYNGTNNDDESKKIYNEWINLPQNIAKLNNNKDLNMRSAILDKFKKDGKILISTEAGAEGLNLQFCSLLINYDLPWNPQRIEQRIGRCHRFGQKHDVTVINFINNSNKVEQRVYELLTGKFQVFNEIFGASDEVLGTISNIDNLETEISNIYQNCRTAEEIDDAFDKLQEKYSNEIKQKNDNTRKELIENFEEDLQKYFTDTMEEAEKKINYIEFIFWTITKIVLEENAIFNDQEYSFEIINLPKYKGKYKLMSRNTDDEYIDYNINSELGKYVLETIRKVEETTGTIKFDITNYQYNIKEIENLKNKKGIIQLNKYIINSYDKEEYLYFTGRLEDGTPLDDELIQKMFRLNSTEDYFVNFNINTLNIVKQDSEIYSNKIFNESTEKNNAYLSNEISRINNWADDKVQAIELEVEQMREQRKELRKQSDISTNSSDKIRIESDISKLTEKISKKWLELSENEDMIEAQRHNMVEAIRKENMKTTELNNVFTLEFEVL